MQMHSVFIIFLVKWYFSRLKTTTIAFFLNTFRRKKKRKFDFVVVENYQNQKHDIVSDIYRS